MTYRLRVYESGDVDHQEADRIFYEQVRPVHERHGARFVGRWRDERKRVHVLWEYRDVDAMRSIQGAVANDPETLASAARRRAMGLHGLPFQEFSLESTDPTP